MKTDASYRFILKQTGLIVCADVKSADHRSALLFLQHINIYGKSEEPSDWIYCVTESLKSEKLQLINYASSV